MLGSDLLRRKASKASPEMGLVALLVDVERALGALASLDERLEHLEELLCDLCERHPRWIHRRARSDIDAELLPDRLGLGDVPGFGGLVVVLPVVVCVADAVASPAQEDARRYSDTLSPLLIRAMRAIVID
jgi:hypothetical protein